MIQISCKIDRDSIFNNREQKESFIITNYNLQMTKAADDISIIINKLNRCNYYKTNVKR